DGTKTAKAPDSIANCLGLTEIVIPEGVDTIGKSAFYAARDLKKVTLPQSLKSIGDNAFINVEFETVTYMGTAEQWNQVQGSHQIDQSKIVFMGS
ncbi:MAG: leucine-rich repeat protein, partial [Erysipelotrichaceae bacterium]|nr:leucine-rich repeat protein [Erysipelotrichaceae bacterium]